jgi:hypothetical protein
LSAAFACLPELPCLQPFVGNLTHFLLRRRLRNLPPLLRRRRSGSPAGGAVCLAAGFRLAAIPPLGVTAFRYTALARPSFHPSREAREAGVIATATERSEVATLGIFSSKLWNACGIFPTLGNGAPAARAPP